MRSPLSCHPENLLFRICSLFRCSASRFFVSGMGESNDSFFAFRTYQFTCCTWLLLVLQEMVKLCRGGDSIKRDDLKVIIDALFDRPLTADNKGLVVNRKDEIRQLNLLAEIQPGGIYGLCGETGIGKTTVLDLVGGDSISKVKIVLSEKDSKEAIISDLLYKLSTQLEHEKKELGKRAQQARKWLLTEITRTSSFSAGGSAIVSAGASKTVSSHSRFNIYEAKDIFKELLQIHVADKGKSLLVIDELDKEKKEDVMAIVDSLKGELNLNGLIVLFTLPFIIYREYAIDRMKWNESGNLENIFKDVIYLSELPDKEIQEMLLKRLASYPDLFDAEAYSRLVFFSDGNPRDALWIATQTILDNIGTNRINGKQAEKSIRKIVGEYYRFGRLPTDNQRDILKIVAANPGKRNEVIESLRKGGIKRTTAYVTLDRLFKDGFLIEREGSIRISGKTYFIL